MEPSLPKHLQSLLEQQEWLHGLARRLLGRGPDAEDLVQETMARALQAKRPVSRGWLATVARNLRRDTLRGDSNRLAREASVARPERIGGSEELQRAALRRSILDEILQLGEPERTALVLRYLEGRDYAQMAEQLGISQAAARKRVSRGIDALREVLDRREGGREAWAGLLSPLIPDWIPPASAAAFAGPAWMAVVFAMKSKLLLALPVLVLAMLAPFVLPKGEPLQSPIVEVGPAEGLAQLAPLAPPQADLEARSSVTGSSPDEPEEGATSVLAFSERPGSEVGSLELLVRWSDGTPADGVQARLMPWGAGDAFLWRRDVVTGRGGSVRIEQLSPGKVGVYLGRGGGGVAEVQAGELSSLQVTVPEGFTVTGRVLGPAGQPVAGATICLSSHGNESQGKPVAVADGSGRYEVRDITDQRYLSARAPGFAPSDQLYSKGASGGRGELDLVLRGKGGVLRGLVLSPDGLPVEGARVRVKGTPPRGWEAPEDGRWRESEPLPFEVRSDAEGRFQLDQLGDGIVEVTARTEAWVPWTKSVTIPEGGASGLTIRFQVGATLRGRVLFADGRPAAGIEVLSGNYGSFDSHRATADDEGRFVMQGLPLGKRELRGQIRQVGKVKATVLVAKGDQNTCELTLVEGRQLRGTVRDEGGSLLSGWMVGITNGQGLWTNSTRTESDGSFLLGDLPEGAIDLVVGPPDVFQTGAALTLEGVQPAETPIEVVIPDARRSRSSMTFLIHVDGQPAPAETRLVVRGTSRWFYRECNPSPGGRVTLPRMSEGSYSIEAHLADYPVGHWSFDLARDADLDLGTLHLGTGGKLRVELTGPGVAGLIEASVLNDQDVETDSFYFENGVGESGLLNPGPLRVRLGGEETAMQILEGVIEAGQTTLLRATTRPGVTRHILVRRSDGQPLKSGTSLRVTASDGQVQRYDPDMLQGMASRQAKAWVTGLVVGDYRVQVQGPSGKTAEAVLSVRTLDVGDEDPLVITLD